MTRWAIQEQANVPRVDPAEVVAMAGKIHNATWEPLLVGYDWAVENLGATLATSVVEHVAGTQFKRLVCCGVPIVETDVVPVGHDLRVTERWLVNIARR